MSDTRRRSNHLNYIDYTSEIMVNMPKRYFEI